MTYRCDKCDRADCVCLLQCDTCFEPAEPGFDAGDECLCGGTFRDWTPAVVESPYGGDPETVARNLRYLRACLHWCVHNGFTPYASHGLLTQPGVLRDELPGERRLGLGGGLALGDLLPVRLVFTDLGITSGMEAGIKRATRLGQHVITVRLTAAWEARRYPDDLGWIWSMGQPQPEDAPNASAWRSNR